jgi:NADP-dependent 3-hydroxy acid dehydrogenase YdfG
MIVVTGAASAAGREACRLLDEAGLPYRAVVDSLQTVINNHQKRKASRVSPVEVVTVKR